MTFGAYYPEQRHVIGMATIRRERLLPEDAIGSVETREGERVDLRTIVAQGTIPTRYIIIEAAHILSLKDSDDLAEYLLVEKGEAVEANEVLASRAKSADRGKRVFAPATGVIAYIDQGRIILQETPELIDLEAGVNGQIIAVRPGRGVVIETIGALIQGVWGNGKSVIGTLRMEPEEGLENIFADQIDIQYRGAIVVTKRPLKATGLLVMENQEFGGIVAPGMDADLYEDAHRVSGAILITEGFGAARFSSIVASLLSDLSGRQATLDALMPNRWERQRPELVINLPATRAGERPPAPNLALTLRPGMTVRLTRPPYAGQIGQVSNLPKTPHLLDNGLRVPCAQVELVAGGTAFVPLANLEVLGR